MTSPHFKFTLLALCFTFGLAACQSTPTPEKKPSPTVTKNKPQHETPEGIKVTPYERPEIIREKAPEISIPQSKAPTQRFDDGQDTPAVKHLVQATKTAFQNGQWAEAEKYALHMQRLAPQSYESYYWLAEIALKQNKATNAESLARRGLSYAQTSQAKKQLWQVLLRSGQTQKKQVLIQEAQTHLKVL